MRLSHQLTPPGGWKYKQGEILIHGMTWSELLTNVIAHRASNKMDVGNPEVDIEDQIIKENPSSAVRQFKSIISNGR